MKEHKLQVAKMHLNGMRRAELQKISEDKTFTYKNKYGSVTLQRMSKYQHIGTCHSPINQDNLFITIDEAEQLALITGNRHIQISFDLKRKLNQAYVLLHKSTSQCAYVQIKNMKYVHNDSAQHVLKYDTNY